MTKKLHKEIPIDYAVCQQQDCPRAEKCLHQIAYRPLIEQPATVLRLLNPTLCIRDGACPYFERRRGEFPLSPKEQRIVLNALRRVGVTEELRFDQYEESVNWYD